MVDAQTLANVIEASADRKRGRRQDHRVEFLEQPFPQDLANIDRCRRQENSLVPPLVPVDEIPLVRFEQEGQLLPQLEAPPRDARQFFRLCRERRKFRLQAFQRSCQRIVSLAVLFEKRRALVSSK